MSESIEVNDVHRLAQEQTRQKLADHDDVAALARQLRDREDGFLPRSRIADADDVATLARAILENRQVFIDQTITMSRLEASVDRINAAMVNLVEIQSQAIAASTRMSDAADRLWAHLEARNKA